MSRSAAVVTTTRSIGSKAARAKSPFAAAADIGSAAAGAEPGRGPVGKGNRRQGQGAAPVELGQRAAGAAQTALALLNWSSSASHTPAPPGRGG